jgi:FkbM family methyltransferase
MRHLIFDIGMNNGDDTEYYLAKNYNVVAVEANSQLCEVASKRFSDAISRGQLVILNVAITESFKDCTFYINIENNHWSSLDIRWANRNNKKVLSSSVKGVPIISIIERFGCPYYLKTDIEGNDITILNQLNKFKIAPEFLSIEDCRFGFEYIELLSKIGYQQFKLSNQALVPHMKDASIDHNFQLGASGLFGEDLPGEWLACAPFLELYERTVRSRNTLLRKASPEIWWDIHCTL